MTANMITIHFITEGRGSDFDDIIKITRVPDEEDLFEATYIYASSRRTKRARFTLEKTMNWIQCILRLTLADNEPANEIQFTAPMMPATLFNVGELMENFGVLTDAIQFSLENWPEEDGVVADDASTLTYTSEESDASDASDAHDEEEHHPTPPHGSEPMDEEASVRGDPRRSVSLDADGRIMVQARGTHHLFFPSDTE